MAVPLHIAIGEALMPVVIDALRDIEDVDLLMGGVLLDESEFFDFAEVIDLDN
jgi:predicted nucleotidyltransferase